LRNSIGSGVILIFISWIGLNMLVLTVPSINEWCLRSLADPGFWRGSIPWKSILSSLSIGVGGTVLAAKRFTQQEF
jgi:hypothetical protein